MPKSAFGTPAFSPDLTWQRIVIVDVHAMRGLRKADTFGKSDPYYILKCPPTAYPESFVSHGRHAAAAVAAAARTPLPHRVPQQQL